MKCFLLIAILFTLPSYSHLGHHHHHLEGLPEWSSGIVSLAWNTLELAMHTGEFFGYKTACCHSHCGHSHDHHHQTSQLIQAYHAIELVTHGLNLFDVTAKISDSISDTIEEYVPTQVISASTLAFNLAVIVYRANDIKKQLSKSSYLFAAWGLIDALGHANSIYLSSI